MTPPASAPRPRSVRGIAIAAVAIAAVALAGVIGALRGVEPAARARSSIAVSTTADGVRVTARPIDVDRGEVVFVSSDAARAVSRWVVPEEWDVPGRELVLEARAESCEPAVVHARIPESGEQALSVDLDVRCDPILDPAPERDEPDPAATAWYADRDGGATGCTTTEVLASSGGARTAVGSCASLRGTVQLAGRVVMGAAAAVCEGWERQGWRLLVLPSSASGEGEPLASVDVTLAEQESPRGDLALRFRTASFAAPADGRVDLFFSAPRSLTSCAPAHPADFPTDVMVRVSELHPEP